MSHTHHLLSLIRSVTRRRRCQGKRGCLCIKAPSGQQPPVVYAGLVHSGNPHLASSAQSVPVTAVSTAKGHGPPTTVVATAKGHGPPLAAVAAAKAQYGPPIAVSSSSPTKGVGSRAGGKPIASRGKPPARVVAIKKSETLTSKNTTAATTTTPSLAATDTDPHTPPTSVQNDQASDDEAAGADTVPETIIDDASSDSAPITTGLATLRYNHYTKEVTITSPPGDISIADVDELFSLSYGFRGNYVIHLRGPGRDGPVLPQTTSVISGVTVGEEYWCEVDEDPDEAAKEKVTLFMIRSMLDL